MEVFLIKLLQFVLAISLLVLLHELGHFTAAKIFKVRVTRFYLFFNPYFHLVSTYDTWVRKLLKLKPTVVPTTKDADGNEVKEYVGTEYGIGWLPLGGYCAIDGMIDETNTKLSEETHPWEFRTKPRWQRLIIMVAGVTVNFLLALFIYSMIMFHYGESYVRMADMSEGMKFNTEAKAYGFQDHDILLATDKGEFKDFNVDVYRDLSSAKWCDVRRDGKTVRVNLSGDINLLSMLKTSPTFVRPFIPAVVDSVFPTMPTAGGKDSVQTPAAQIGMMKGDRILAVNGNKIDSYNEFTQQIALLSDSLATAKSPADSLRLRTVKLELEKAPATAAAADGKTQGLNTVTVEVTLTPDMKLGIAAADVGKLYADKVTKVSYGFFESFPAGVKYGWNVLSGYVSDLQYVFSADGAKSLGGFGTIGSLFPSQWNWYMFWMMTAFLSIILAFMNILPIPMLDGGYTLFLIVEMITRRRLPDKFIIYANYVGLALLLLLMVVANLNDILRWLGVM